MIARHGRAKGQRRNVGGRNGGEGERAKGRSRHVDNEAEGGGVKRASGVAVKGIWPEKQRRGTRRVIKENESAGIEV